MVIPSWEYLDCQTFCGIDEELPGKIIFTVNLSWIFCN